MTDKSLAVQAANDIDIMTLGKLLAQSGYFADAKDAAQAVVKVLAGRELGLGPVASMTGVYIVKGKPSLSANLLAGVLKRSGKYTFRVAKHDDTVCEIAFFERLDGKWEEIGRSVFALSDAKRAGTQNMDRFPRNMLYARAMTNGIRWYCPDVFAGGVYTPEELGAPVDGEGEPVQPAPPPAGVVEQPAQPVMNGKADNMTALRARYNDLAAQARILGIDPEPVEAFDFRELMEAGKALKSRVQARQMQMQYDTQIEAQGE